MKYIGRTKRKVNNKISVLGDAVVFSEHCVLPNARFLCDLESEIVCLMKTIFIKIEQKQGLVGHIKALAKCSIGSFRCSMTVDEPVSQYTGDWKSTDTMINDIEVSLTGIFMNISSSSIQEICNESWKEIKG